MVGNGYHLEYQLVVKIVDNHDKPTDYKMFQKSETM